MSFLTMHESNVDPSEYYAILAAWILPVDQPPLRDGAVVIDGRTNRILAVGPRATLASAGELPERQFDRRDATLIPGLVNAHTHLEFSDLSEPLGQPGIAFTAWIAAIVACRRDANDQSPSKRASVQAGIRESFRHGVWAVGDIATLPIGPDDYALDDDSNVSQDFHRTVFLEQLGRDIAKLPELDVVAKQFRQAFESSDIGRLNPALSPHAPYSTHPRLVQQLCEGSAANGQCVAMHLAETLEERELLDEQTGPFVDLLKKFGVWNPKTFAARTSILDALHQLATAHRSLVIHGNYLNEQELDFIAGQGDRMSIVFCPRTHEYFQHRRYPLAEMRTRGINVAVGTDSRASNPDLRIVRELQRVTSFFPDVPANDVLSMGTLNAARALGIDKDFGSLTPGKIAAISAMGSSAGASRQPFDWLAEDTITCRPVVAGQIV